MRGHGLCALVASALCVAALVEIAPHPPRTAAGTTLTAPSEGEAWLALPEGGRGLRQLPGGPRGLRLLSRSVRVVRIDATEPVDPAARDRAPLAPPFHRKRPSPRSCGSEDSTGSD